jgi:hypothetical protein
MSLLILLSAPSVSALLCMVAAITNQTIYPRLRGRECRVIQFPAITDRAYRHRGRNSF